MSSYLPYEDDMLWPGNDPLDIVQPTVPVICINYVHLTTNHVDHDPSPAFILICLSVGTQTVSFSQIICNAVLNEMVYRMSLFDILVNLAWLNFGAIYNVHLLYCLRKHYC